CVPPGNQRQGLLHQFVQACMISLFDLCYRTLLGGPSCKVIRATGKGSADVWEKDITLIHALEEQNKRSASSLKILPIEPILVLDGLGFFFNLSDPVSDHFPSLE